MNASASFLDLRFDLLSIDEVAHWISKRDRDSSFAYIVTPNVDHLVRLAKAQAEVRAAYRDATLCVCDSRVLARLARMTGTDLTLVPGSDLSAALFKAVLRPGDRVCLIGSTTDDAAQLRNVYPKLKIVQHVPPFGLRENAAARARAIAFAADAQARVTLLAVGSPQQELLAHEMGQDGRVRGTALCIGASVEFLVGSQKRAPRFVQKSGMEWAWRLAREPRRLARRYLVEGPAIFALVWRWHRARRPI